MADSNRRQNSEVSTMSNMMGKYFTGKRILKVLVIFFAYASIYLKIINYCFIHVKFHTSFLRILSILLFLDFIVSLQGYVL